jgi:hypothetical protein
VPELLVLELQELDILVLVLQEQVLQELLLD